MFRSALLAVVATLIAVHSAGAAVSYSDLFNGSPASEWSPTLGGTGAVLGVDYTGGTAVFAPAAPSNDASRRYLRTNDVDYHLHDFTASVVVTARDHHVFFGMGPGETGGTNFGEPRGTGTFAFLRLNPGTGGNIALIYGTENTFIESTATIPGGASDSPIRFQLDWTAGTQTMLVSIDVGNNNSFEYISSSLDLSSLDFSGNGRLFIGSGNGAFDNFNVTVVPEPAGALILGIGSLLMLRRRRA